MQPGDNLTAIARSRGTTPRQLAAINCVGNSDVIRVGQDIYVPALADPSTITPTPTFTPAPTSTPTSAFSPLASCDPVTGGQASIVVEGPGIRVTWELDGGCQPVTATIAVDGTLLRTATGNTGSLYWRAADICDGEAVFVQVTLVGAGGRTLLISGQRIGCPAS